MLLQALQGFILRRLATMAEAKGRRPGCGFSEELCATPLFRENGEHVQGDAILRPPSWKGAKGHSVRAISRIELWLGVVLGACILVGLLCCFGRRSARGSTRREIAPAIPSWGAVRDITAFRFRVTVMPVSLSPSPLAAQSVTFLVDPGTAKTYVPRIELPFSFEDTQLIVWAVPMDETKTAKPQLFELHFPEMQPLWERQESAVPFWGLIMLRERREDSVVKAFYNVDDLPPAILVWE